MVSGPVTVAVVISGCVGIYISRTCSTDILGFGSGSGCPSNTNSRSSVVTVSGMETLPSVHSWIGCLPLNHWPVLLGSSCFAAQRLRAAQLICLSTRAAESPQFWVCRRRPLPWGLPSARSWRRRFWPSTCSYCVRQSLSRHPRFPHWPDQRWPEAGYGTRRIEAGHLRVSHQSLLLFQSARSVLSGLSRPRPESQRPHLCVNT